MKIGITDKSFDNRYPGSFILFCKKDMSEFPATDRECFKTECETDIEILRFVYENIDMFDDTDFVEFSNGSYISASDMSVNTKVVVGKPVVLGEYNFRNHYSHYFSETDIASATQAIESLYPDYTSVTDNVLNSNYYLTLFPFKLSVADFKLFCEFFFDIFDFIDAAEDIVLYLWNVFLSKNFEFSEISLRDIIDLHTNPIFTLKTNPKVSVVVPAYNQCEYLRDCLDSLSDQKFKDWECLIVDDGSPDRCREIAEIYCKRDSRFRFYHTANKGVGAARNFGFSKSSGKYFMNLDADDFLDPDYIETCVKEFESSDKILIVSPKNFSFMEKRANIDYKCDGENEMRYIVEYNPENMLVVNSYGLHSGSMIKSLDFKKTTGYDEDLPGFEDWEFFIRFLNRFPDRVIAGTTKCLYFYRHKKKSRNTEADANQYEILKLVVDKNPDIYGKVFPVETWKLYFDKMIEQKKAGK